MVEGKNDNDDDVGNDKEDDNNIDCDDVDE